MVAARTAVPGPRRGRRLWFAAGALAVVVLAIEGLGAIAWWLSTGAPFTWRRAADARAAARPSAGAAAAEPEQAAQQAANAGTVVHPYLGFVCDADLGAIAGVPVSPFGFMDPSPPLHERGDDRYVVGVLGGSVALQFALYAGDELAAQLQKSPRLSGRRIEIVRLGLGGYKQPQQLFALQLAWLLGGEFDAVVCIDGFNEVALVDENLPHGVPAWFPRGWYRLLDALPTPAQQRRLGQLAVLRDERGELAAAADAVWWSPTLQSLWLHRDRALAARIAALAAEAERALGAASFAVTGPGTGGQGADAARGEMVALWRRASLDLQALCRLHGASYFHFLQPNQYVAGSKPIGAEEARVALDPTHPYARAVVAGYPLLQAAGEQLRAAGVPFVDLTGLFAAHDEPLYVDTCCHFGRRGNELLAVRIAGEIRRRLDLEGFVATGLRLPASPLRIASPVAPVPLPVLAVDAAGAGIDVAGDAFGTRLTVEPAGLVDVRADGGLLGRRRGRGTITVAHAGLTGAVDVVVDWPDVLTVDDGLAPAGGDAVPRLAAVHGARAGAGGVEVGCTGLPADGLRLLAASLAPLPPALRPGEESFGVATALLGGGGPSITAASPLSAEPARPLFLRVFVVAADSGAVTASSNLLVLTAE